MIRYDVLLSMPPADKPNTVTLLDAANGEVILKVQGTSEVRNVAYFNHPLPSP